MAISKLILNGVIQMDVTGVTVEASNLLAPNTAVGADGQPVTGTATEKVLTTKRITANGTYDAEDDNADGYSSVTVNVPSSGGASNVVTGTFKGTTTGAAMDVNIPYTGNGYPIAISIYPKGGTVELSSLIQKYAIVQAEINKYDASLTPDYNASGQAAYGTLSMIYKNSTSSAATVAASTALSTRIYRNSDSSAGSTTFLRIKSNKKLSVFIASTSYGFVANTEYTYHIIYSS